MSADARLEAEARQETAGGPTQAAREAPTGSREAMVQELDASDLDSLEALLEAELPLPPPRTLLELLAGTAPNQQYSFARVLRAGDGLVSAAVLFRFLPASVLRPEDPSRAADGEMCEVLCLAVRPSLRRRGLATALLRSVEDCCRGRGVASLELLCQMDNRAARAFYAARGFSEAGVLRDCYPAELGAALRLEKAVRASE